MKIKLHFEEKSKYWLISIFSLVVFFGGWWLYSVQPGTVLSTPAEVVEKLFYMASNPIAKVTLFGHIISSFRRVIIAFSTASVIGILLGIGFGWFKTFRRLVYPLFSILRPIPPIALIPLIILWFGIGETSKILVIFFACLMPTVLNTYSGIASADKLLLNASKVMGANNRQMLINVALPNSIPAIIAGMKTGLNTGWLAVVAAEMVAAKTGVGFLIVHGMEELDVALVIASIVVIALVSVMLTIILNKLERGLCPWLYLNQK